MPFFYHTVPFMLYQFMRDMWAVLRLRYKKPEEYRYSLPVNLAVLLLIGIVNAAASSPLFGKSTPLVVFAVLLTVLKCAVLSRVMSAVLRRPESPALPFWGFVLVTESLSVPLLLLFYFPSLAGVGLFWQIWIFWVQIIGFIQISGQKGGKVAIGYVAYAFTTLIGGTLLILLFAQAGWLDVQQLAEQFNDMLNNSR